jgi:hypothetical protein
MLEKSSGAPIVAASVWPGAKEYWILSVSTLITPLAGLYPRRELVVGVAVEEEPVGAEAARLAQRSAAREKRPIVADIESGKQKQVLLTKEAVAMSLSN